MKTKPNPPFVVVRLGPHQYQVGQYGVDLRGDTPCHCPDYLYRKEGKVDNGNPATCKHMRAAGYLEGSALSRLEVRLPR